MTPSGARPDRGGKAKDAFRTISEVADYLGLAQHVLRFWESKFSQLKPLKRGGNRRYYRPSDIRLLEALQILLHKEGYTIRGVQKLFKEQGLNETIEAAMASRPVEPIPNIEPVLRPLKATESLQQALMKAQRFNATTTEDADQPTENTRPERDRSKDDVVPPADTKASNPDSSSEGQTGADEKAAKKEALAHILDDLKNLRQNIKE